MTPRRPARADRVFLRLLDERLSAGALRAGGRLACRVGCTECCIGPFPINVLDALRLMAGLAVLRRRAPARAAAVIARARAAVERLRPAFPGQRESGLLAPDEDLREAFFARHQDLPCPALDPERGSCDLYEWRPVTCRTYGLPIRAGDEDLPPCRLCFVQAPGGEVEACRVEVDPERREDALLDALGDDPELPRETVIAFALLR
ncbi:MAG TPA: YkgJ family cysteine cluster protein [Vicinamibacteria bacterium]|nr:YkgJ family cysteine cluster protein [Vicinamibacteria bacterium]